MNKEIKQMKKETWLIASLLFLSLIFLILFAFTAYLKDTAWIFLGFAGTALSLVLSVIAIVITLVDVAGQKQQVADISESAKKLKIVIDEQKNENKNLKQELLNHLNKESIVDLSEIKDSLNDISENIQSDNEDKALVKIADFNKSLEEKIIRLKSIEDRTSTRGGNQMKVKQYRVRKGISEKDLLDFKNEKSNEVFEIQSIWIDKQDNENYDLLNIESTANELRLSDLVVIVMASFYVR